MATEKRLIDVNKVIDQMQKCIDESPYARDSIASYTFGAIIEALKKEPTVDAVEVVRCEDCKYRVLDTVNGEYWCNHTLGLCGEVYATYFCCHGERKDND